MQTLPKRVVVTGMGIVSSLGNDLEQVAKALYDGRSGIVFNEEFQARGLRSHVSGNIQIDDSLIDRKSQRFMGLATRYGYLALVDAIAHAGLTQDMLSDPTTGLIVGSGGVASEDLLDALEHMQRGGIRKVGPYRVIREMASAPSALLATEFKIKGPSFTVSSACATSAHCIGEAYLKIKHGLLNRVIAGGVDHAHWTQAFQFDGMGALSTGFNQEPQRASRPYDQDRDGFVISGGAGMLILEEESSALARGATIYGEVVGYGASSDGDSMVQPSGEGGERAMQLALVDAGIEQVDYVNTHGTSTPAGDITELKSIARVFAQRCPHISSTKSLSGHGLGAAGVQEAIYTLLMIKNKFIAASINIEKADTVAAELPIVTISQPHMIDTALSNSFGFGGTNASLIFKRR